MQSDDALDQTLIARVAAQDRAAMRALFLRHYRDLLRFALRLVQRPELAEEVVNEALFTAWQQAARFRGASRVSTWLMGIVYRKGLHALRARTDTAAADEYPEPLDPAPQPDVWLEMTDRARQLRAALAQLSAVQRAVIELTYFQDLSCAEAAQVLCCPVDTVKTRMFHARRRLRTLLPQLAPELESALDRPDPKRQSETAS